MRTYRWTCLLLSCLLFGQPVTRDLRLERSGKALDGRGKLWAVVVGVSQYRNVPPAAQLRFADRDAEDFAAFLRSPQGGGFPASQIRLLTNDQATLPALRTALGTWLPRSAEESDVVYIYFAGHGVMDNGQDGYLLAHDSDPQNLYATALSVPELDKIVNERIKARMVVLVADACHAGSIGWASRGEDQHPLLISRYLEEVGKTSRSVLRLLASRASERSYEDERWGGGHGVFTFSLLEGLRGKAEREHDGVIRASELIDYVSALVPDQTQALQHPRVAGNYEAQLPLAVVGGGNAAIPKPVSQVPARKPIAPAVPAVKSVSLEVHGPAGAEVYVDSALRGHIRPAGLLVVPDLTPGEHELSIEQPGAPPVTQRAVLETARVVFDATAALAVPKASPLVAQIRQGLREGKLLNSGGAWDLYERYRHETPQDPQHAEVTALIVQALEETGQRSVNDYVQSSTAGLKRDMLRQSAEAYRRLMVLRPNEPSLEGKQLFCEGRALILEGKPREAIPVLQRSIAVDPKSACPYNALGVAYERTGDAAKALEFYLKAARLTPEWYLPQWQLATQQQTQGNLAAATTTMKSAVSFSPQIATPRFALTRLYRLQGRLPEGEAEALELIRRQPGYAPIYAELGLIYETANRREAAAEAYDAYVQLAPNFADSAEVRARAVKLRSAPAAEAPRKVPSLQRK